MRISCTNHSSVRAALRWMAAFLVFLLFPAAVLAEAGDALTFDESVLSETMTAIMLDADSGEVLYSRRPDEIIYPASTTKIMTGLLCIELNGGTLDGEVTVGAEVNAFGRSSSLMGLMSDRTVSIRDLIYGLMLVSGNDAAAALAVHFGGSLEGFVQRMNDRAASLGMTNTHFANPHGLDERSIGLDHHSTAADMGKLAQAAFQNPVLMEVMGTQSYQVTSTELNPNIRPDPVLHNGNYLLETPVNEPQRSRYAQYRYTPTTGMKTGLLANVDGYDYYGCLVASASQDGRNLIAAVFADTSNNTGTGAATARWRTVISLFEFGFTGFTDVDLTTYVQPPSAVQVLNSAKNDPEGGLLALDAAAGTDMVVSLDRGLAADLAAGRVQVETVQRVPDGLEAPITQGTEIGTLVYQINGEELLSVPLLAARSVYAQGDEETTSSQYGVADPTKFPWWMWLVIGGAAAAVVVFLLLRRRRPRRYIDRPRFGNGHYGSRRYSWNDDVPLSDRSRYKQSGKHGRRF